MKEYWNDLSGGQKAKLILKIIIGLFAVIFAVRNWQSVDVILVFFKMKMPLTLIIMLCIGIGFATSSIFDYKKFKKKNSEIAELKAKLTPSEETENK